MPVATDLYHAALAVARNCASRTDIEGLERLRAALEQFEAAASEAPDASPPMNTDATDALESAFRDCLNRYGRPPDHYVRHVAEGMESLLWVYGYKIVSNFQLMAGQGREILQAGDGLRRSHPDSCGVFDGPLAGDGRCSCGAESWNAALDAVAAQMEAIQNGMPDKLPSDFKAGADYSTRKLREAIS